MEKDLIKEISWLLNRLGIDLDPADYFGILDFLYTKYKIHVSISPYLYSPDHPEETGIFTYDVWDLELDSDNKVVSENFLSYKSSSLALQNGLTEALSYVLLYKDAGIIVAIDGYPACGKSTIAKRLAKDVGYTYIDSGAMYRAAALYFDRTKEEINEKNVKKIHISFRKDTDKNQITLLNGEDVEKEIRTLRISKLASEIGVIDCVRFYLGDMQREMGKIGGVIMDGRDIGTVVFPKAQLKLFLTADQEVRALRRLKELGDAVSFEEVLADTKERDWRDIDQFEGKRKAPDATVLNNTDLTEDEQYEIVKKLFNIAVRKYRAEK